MPNDGIAGAVKLWIKGRYSQRHAVALQHLRGEAIADTTGLVFLHSLERLYYTLCIELPATNLISSFYYSLYV